MPVEAFFSREDGFSQADIQDLVPVFRDANTFGGKLWTLPFNKSIYVLFYNKDLFDMQGLRPPSTWDELRTVAKAFTSSEGGGRYGIVFTPSVDIFGHSYCTNRGEFLDGNKAVFNSPIGVKSLEYWVDLANNDHSALPTFNAFEDFIAQKGVMYIDTTSRMRHLLEKARFSVGIATLPAGAIRRYQFAGTNLAIFSHSSPEKRYAAWRFIKFLISPETTAYWATKTGYLPVRKSAIQSTSYQEYLRSRTDFSVGVKSLDFAVVQPKSPAWESIRGIIDDAIYDALSRKRTPREALDDAVSTANSLLSKLGGTGQ
jgi:ABC-type glycerol-3-phosphate transport system substrate-binding protein